MTSTESTSHNSKARTTAIEYIKTIFCTERFEEQYHITARTVVDLYMPKYNISIRYVDTPTNSELVVTPTCRLVIINTVGGIFTAAGRIYYLINTYQPVFYMPADVVVRIICCMHDSISIDKLTLGTMASVSKAFNKVMKANRKAIVDHYTERYIDGSTIRYVFCGMYHREGDLPAVLKENGTLEWRQYSELHRDGDKPAIERADGGKEWHIHGKLHRDGDQPAKIDSDGQYWYIDGVLHRDGDKPAIVRADGTWLYYTKGKLHRENDKPAIEKPSGTLKWYKNGKLHRAVRDQPAIIHANGNKEWRQRGQLHRARDRPAIEYINGGREWWRNGVLDRDFDQPAVVEADGHSVWYRCGRKHRQIGPAVIYANGNTEHWYDGQRVYK